MLAFLALAQDSTVVPAYAAYAEPAADGIEIEGRNATTGWKRTRDSLVWYGEAAKAATVVLRVTLKAPTAGRLTLTVGKTRRTLEPDGTNVDFGTFAVGKGPVRVALSSDRVPGPEVTGLQATGDVRWSDSKRRNAASVHLWWDAPKDAKVLWFTNEAAMLTDPEWSYTMACGFSRGYMGMQVNSPTERRIIFSVWGSGIEAVNRSKVDAQDRVELVAKGKGAVADSFGNEGTGGHSHLVFPWKTGVPLRFLVGCRPEGNKTLYAGYFMAPGDKAWRLLAAFRAPKDGGTLRGLYSFSEDFAGANGPKWRESAFGNGWIGLSGDVWLPLQKARFTTDGHGDTERWDYDAFEKDGRFHIRHGGFTSGTVRYGNNLGRPGIFTVPKIAMPTLPE